MAFEGMARGGGDEAEQPAGGLPEVPPGQAALPGGRAGLHARTGLRAGAVVKHRLCRVLAMLSVVAAVACTPIYANHGYIPDEDDLAIIKTGVDTRDTVAGFLGQPSVEGLLGDSEWFYVQSRFRTVGMREKVEIDRQVVAITFNEAGTVANIERFGLEKGEVVVISRRVTTETIKGRSALAQIFASIGRIDPTSLLNK